MLSTIFVLSSMIDIAACASVILASGFGSGDAKKTKDVMIAVSAVVCVSILLFPMVHFHTLCNLGPCGRMLNEELGNFFLILL